MKRPLDSMSGKSQLSGSWLMASQCILTQQEGGRSLSGSLAGELDMNALPL